MAYVPPHKRGDRRGEVEERRTWSPGGVRGGPWLSLESLAVLPEDSVSNVAVPDDSLPLSGLTEAEVAQCLVNLGLGKYANLALSCPLRGVDLQHCREEDLESIGFTFRPHRLSLLEDVRSFVEGGVPSKLLQPHPANGELGAPSPAPPPARPRSTASASDDSKSTSDVKSETPTWLLSAEAGLEAPLERVCAPAAGAAAVAEEGGGASGEAGPRAEEEAYACDEGPRSSPGARDEEGVAEGHAAVGYDAGASPCGAGLVRGTASAESVRSTPSRELLPRLEEAPELALISAELEGLSLRSEAGTAVRAVERGARAPERWGSATPGAQTPPRARAFR